MKKILSAAVLSSILLTGVVNAGLAATTAKSAAKGKTAASSTLKCPSCGMPMPTKASKMFPVPVHVNGKTYYCCTKCPSGQAAMKSMKGSHKKAAS